MPCPACSRTFDHMHQFVNLLGSTMTVWVIDGQEFTTIGQATRYLMPTYDLSSTEALNFIRDMQRFYN